MTGVLFCSLSAFVSNHATCTSYIIRRKNFRLWQLEVLIMFEIWIFFLQNLWICYKPCEARFIMDACALFDVFWTVEQKHPPTPVIKLRRARTIVYITPIGFIWKKSVIYTYMPQGWVNNRAIFLFGWTNTLISITQTIVIYNNLGPFYKMQKRIDR